MAALTREEMTMPMTPDEALEKNRGRTNLQYERAIQALLAEAEVAITYYTGNPVYLGLPAYLHYKAQADQASGGEQLTLKAVDRAMDARFGPSGWGASIVVNDARSYYWVKLRDARKP
jgi:hypothetical protein